MLNEQDEKYTQEIEQLKTEVYSWLREERVEIPEEVKSAIEEAFSDADYVMVDDTVNVYFKEDLDQFEEDITLQNNYTVQLNGMSSGINHGTYTYCDNISYSVSEHAELKDGDELIEILTDYKHTTRSEVVDADDWAICIIETVSWENGEVTRIPRLFIYCPQYSLSARM